MDWTGNGVAVRSERAAKVAEWFGVGKGGKGKRGNEEFRSKSEALKAPDVIRARRIILLTGPSGAGKSSLLREMQSQCAARWINLASIQLPEVPVVDCFGNEPLENILRDLARVGLGEVWTYLRFPSELSEGQRWRLRLAIGITQSGVVASATTPPNENCTVLACDEFAALLDRVTAKVVARCVRKTVTAKQNICFIAATSHDDLIEALEPDVVVRCDFGKLEIRSSKSE